MGQAGKWAWVTCWRYDWAAERHACTLLVCCRTAAGRHTTAALCIPGQRPARPAQRTQHEAGAADHEYPDGHRRGHHDRAVLPAALGGGGPGAKAHA